MPFTISHMVLAPPIYKISRGRLPLAPLAIGCMTPDLYRLFTSADLAITHQWSSLISYNLALGALLSFLWFWLYRPVLYCFLNLSHPLQLHSLKQYISFIFFSAISIVLGASSHLVWDGLTHLDYRTYAFNEFLDQQVHIGTHAYAMHFVLQILFSIIALPPLIWMLFKYIKRHTVTVRKTQSWIRYYAWSLFACSVLSGSLGYWLFANSVLPTLVHTDPYYYLGRSLNRFAGYFLLVFSLGCLLFRYLHSQRNISSD